MKRRILVGLGLVGLFLLVVTARVLYSSRTEHLKGRRAMEVGRIDLAIVHYRRSAHWYAPGNPYVTSSLDALWDIADQAEGAGRIGLALSAYRAIRSSILGTRSFYTPHADRLAKVNQRIAALMARQQLELQTTDRLAARSTTRGRSSRRTTGPATASRRTTGPATASRRTTAPSTSSRPAPSTSSRPSSATSSRPASATSSRPTAPSQSASSPANPASSAADSPEGQHRKPLDPVALRRLEKQHLQLLNKTNMPSVAWSLLAILGMALWVGSAFAFAYRAVTQDDRLDGKKAILWGSLVIVGLAVWLVGLALA